MNTEHKHTPGRWSVTEHNWSTTTIYGPNKERICRICIEDEATEDTQQELERIASANARLIAAAPDLLERLNGLTLRLETIRETDTTGLHLNADIESARAVIARATGREVV